MQYRKQIVVKTKQNAQASELRFQMPKNGMKTECLAMVFVKSKFYRVLLDKARSTVPMTLLMLPRFAFQILRLSFRELSKT